ncbi:hypothetical protein CTEN210_10305 [Chaetoceros tenuissimus]|uniref:Uncharacterized protein n=1 Tax=Chaetoceros tenuissimus TaxID=426638 RepID=A0AAD3CXP3_9STRA|nr:hypothetical protein CTEN210_10305 [Chaetoceros tenuissimus]
MDIVTFQSKLDFIKDLYSNEEWTERECRDDILAALEEAHTKIENAFGKSLFRLRDGKHKPSLKAVEKVVREFPSALSYEDKHGIIPILHIGSHNYDACGFEYMPTLAKEGVMHNVRGEHGRGGLLATQPNTTMLDNNTLQNLCFYSENKTAHLNVLKELRKMGLFVKSDIQEYSLLFSSIRSGRSEEQFEYLTDWDPDALLDIDSLEIFSAECSRADLDILFKAGFKHFPNIGGILFLHDTAGRMVLDVGLKWCYKEKVISALHKILAPSSDYPILHHVYIKAPQHVNLFAKMFRWAYHLKDHNNRTLHQAVLAAGPEVMNANSQLFAALTDDQLLTKDPITTLYPFAAMAVGEHAELGDVFELLRRQPSVFERLDE